MTCLIFHGHLGCDPLRNSSKSRSQDTKMQKDLMGDLQAIESACAGMQLANSAA